jgi:magnesium-transporting ATPase (P-type)
MIKVNWQWNKLSHHLAPNHFRVQAICLLQGSVSEILLNSLDILTFVVPPILPAALTANNAFAQRRLQACILLTLHN